ncbi:Protein of unknown function [Devosia enhydra]|uniref:DUF3168 domain-containing protein n=1 Tax=Devosia enhydra TaxID=665118 RepID=A0A1K2HV02_9HYPH|nr:DUF3168 domain-containing protein [Devosia enhydra]SFZ82424.1 Protein of unknown function [Devosia enhydra]
MSADLALQKAIGARLAAASGVTALVPAANILDRNARPNPDPSIIIGDGQALPDGDYARAVQRITIDLHIWKKEPSLAGVKAIAGAVRTAVRAGRPALDAPYVCGGWHVSAMRYLRDPDGETSHSVVTIEALISEGA